MTSQAASLSQAVANQDQSWRTTKKKKVIHLYTTLPRMKTTTTKLSHLSCTRRISPLKKREAETQLSQNSMTISLIWRNSTQTRSVQKPSHPQRVDLQKMTNPTKTWILTCSLVSIRLKTLMRKIWKAIQTVLAQFLMMSFILMVIVIRSPIL